MLFDLSFFSTLGNLLFRYLTEATVFCLAHAILAVLVWRSIREINEEAGNVNRWAPEKRSQGMCAGLLSQFVHEARSSGEKGIITPMTDFSDRLDSHVNGLEESIHNRINFFVVIGIAGTFFALFQFAQKTSEGTKNAEAITNLLRTSLSNAFPVGFVGLLLTIIAYFISQSRVDRLKNAVSAATARALAIREHLMTSPAVLIQKALNEELAPLRNLDITLGDKLQPIMEKFREQLTETSQMLAGHVAPIGLAAASLQTSTITFTTSMDKLAAAADRLPDALEQIETLQLKTADTVQKMEDSFTATAVHITNSAEALHAAANRLEGSGQVIRETVTEELHRMAESTSVVLVESARKFYEQFKPMETAIDSACASIESAAGVLAATPDKLLARYALQVGELTVRVEAAWKDTGARLIEGLHEHHFEVLRNIREEAERVAKAMNGSALKMREAAENVEITMQRGVRAVAIEAVQRIEPQLISLRDGLLTNVPALQNGFANAAVSALAIEDQAKRTLDACRQIADTLEGPRQRWVVIADKLEKVTMHLEAPSFAITLQQVAADVRKIWENAAQKGATLKSKRPGFWKGVKLWRID